MSSRNRTLDQRYLTNRIKHDATFRRELARQSLGWFNVIYFAKYAFYETADFQLEIDHILEDDHCPFDEILSFRGSAKSTKATQIYPIWAIVGKQQRRYGILVGDTEVQANQYLHNIRVELEENKLLIQDFGPFKPEGFDADWRATTLEIPKYKARLSALSDGQSVRGLREQEVRPDLVVVDDLENTENVRQKGERDKRYSWFKRDLMGIGDRRSRFILIGNLLHSDSIMMRIKSEIQTGKMTGRITEFWITEDGTSHGKPTWPGKFPDQAALDAERKRLGDERTWMRECLGKIVPEDGQEVHEEWIKRWTPDMLTAEGAELVTSVVGVDLAISKNDTADYTCMVRGDVWRFKDGTRKILIQPDPLQARLSFQETKDAMVARAQVDKGMPPTFAIEDVGYQRAAIEEMIKLGVAVEPMKVTTDKRARLRTVAPYIQQGTVLFPETGCEDLLIEMLGFGVEAHDDLVDAFVHCVTLLVKRGMQDLKIVWV